MTGDLISYLYSGYIPEKYGIIVAKKIIDAASPEHPSITFFTVMTSCGIEQISTDDGWYIVKLS